MVNLHWRTIQINKYITLFKQVQEQSINHCHHIEINKKMV
jgi:hypothetical protein